MKLTFCAYLPRYFILGLLSVGCFGLFCIDRWVNNNVVQMEKETFVN